MNIIQLQVMLHHFYDPTPYPKDTPTIRDAHVTLLLERMLERTPEDTCYEGTITGIRDGLPLRSYRVTERGRVFVQGLMSLPLPVQAWTLPKPDER